MYEKKNLIKQILLAFEQSSTSIKYDKIYTFNDGKDKSKQITVSFGITEQGNLKKLISSYCSLNGKLTSKFQPYLNVIGIKPLADNKEFIDLLKQAGSDPVMQMCQERAYDDMYINPAYKFCIDNKMEFELSKLVICDSYLHSGSILPFLRNKFSERTPVNGGNEKVWIESYCKARKDWLENNSNSILRNTVYRMNFMLDRIEKSDWGLTQSPFIANDVKIV